MNPLRVQAANYRTFEHLDLHIPEGCLAIVGANGAGKSSIVQIIDLALFAQRGELAQHLSDHDTGDLSLTLEFEHADLLYRIRRGYSGKGRGKSTLDFEYYEGAAVWQPITRETAQETQAAIEHTIGLTRETFRASAFLAQGDGAAFTEAAPKDRKHILAEVLALSTYDQLADRAHADLQAAQTRRIQLEAQITNGETELGARAQIITERDQAENSRAAVQETLTLCETQVDALTEEETAAREAKAAHDSAKALLTEKETQAQTCRERIAHLALQETAIRDQLAERDTLTERAVKVPALEQELALARDNDRIIDQGLALTRRSEEITRKIEQTEHADECPTCGQKLLGDAQGNALARLDEERAKIIDQIAQLPTATSARPIGNIEHDLRQARDAERQLAVLTEKEVSLVALETERTITTATLRDLDAGVDHQRTEVERLQALMPKEDFAVKLSMLRAQVAQLRSEVTAHAAAVARCDERLDRIASIETSLLEAREDYTLTQQEIDLLVALEKAYGRDGIPMLIVENAALPAIEMEANRILAELPMTDGAIYRVELRTQADLKSGDGVRDTLDILVHGRNGAREYSTFSGGEKSRLNIALRIALARLLANRRGAESRLLVCDEPEYLDATARARLAQILAGMVGDFHRVLFITQYEDVRDAFDQTLTVNLNDGRSHVDQLEAVPA